jgi:hypothetical protein
LKFHVLALAAVAALGALTLAGCEKGKPRHPPPDPMLYMAPYADIVAAAPRARSEGLPKRPELATFSLDRINSALDPLNKQPAQVSAGQPIELLGFGLDPVAKVPAKGVDLVIDGKAYGTVYGAARTDVAAYFKNPAVTLVGFHTTLPAGLVAVGQHLVVVRVIAADGKGYFDGPPIGFDVQAVDGGRH